MDKKRIMLIVLLAVAAIGGTFVGIEKFKNDDKKVTETDAIRFKKEYESLNNTTRESDGAKYNSVTIDEENTIKYINCKEALDVIENKNAIIYFGANWCPWCRNAVPVLLSVAKKYNASVVYYVDLDDEKSMWEVKEGKAIKTIDGSKDYYKLLDKLSDHLRDYSLKDNDKDIPTGEKRIYMPYVIGVKQGNVVSDHVGTVDLDDKQTKYDSLTEKQSEKLEKIYSELFDKVLKDHSNSCSIDGECA